MSEHITQDSQHSVLIGNSKLLGSADHTATHLAQQFSVCVFVLVTIHY